MLESDSMCWKHGVSGFGVRGVNGVLGCSVRARNLLFWVVAWLITCVGWDVPDRSRAPLGEQSLRERDGARCVCERERVRERECDTEIERSANESPRVVSSPTFNPKRKIRI